jgi:hypothetical protein
MDILGHLARQDRARLKRAVEQNSPKQQAIAIVVGYSSRGNPMVQVDGEAEEAEYLGVGLLPIGQAVSFFRATPDQRGIVDG